MAQPDTSPALLSSVAELSAKAIAGNISDEELMRGLTLLREGRMSIGATVAKKAKVDPDAELASLL